MATPVFRHSREHINRCGRLWAAALEEFKEVGDAIFNDADRLGDLLAADEVIAAWRQFHAYPLRMVNANLRWYIKDYSDAHVTQRLKKHWTIVDKLIREPKMASRGWRTSAVAEYASKPKTRRMR